MVEAQPDMLPFVEAAKKKLANAQIANCVLSEKAGEQVTFYQMGTGSSMFAETSNVERKELHLITQTLDDVARDLAAGSGNLFLKIAVQGAELNVLRGGMSTLARAGLVQLEVAMLKYNKGAPLLPEVVGFMADRDFYPIEVSGFSRPRDQLLQIDMLFAPKGSQLRPESFTF
jgi:FkbM family methyltransferase